MTKLLHIVNNPILKYLCKFQVNIPINARIIAVESLKDLYTFILWQPCWWAKERPQPIFPYNIIEKSQVSLAHNSVLLIQTN